MNNAEKVMMDEKFFKGLSKFIEQEKRAEIDPEDLDMITKSVFEFIGNTLGENVKETGIATLECGGYIEFEATHREGEDSSDGNFGINITAGPELKKRIKADDILEEIAE